MSRNFEGQNFYEGEANLSTITECVIDTLARTTPKTARNKS